MGSPFGAPVPVSNPEIPHFIDAPTDWTKLQSCVVVRGWCFSPDGREIGGIRLRIQSLSIAAMTGFFRPDVKAAFPAAPGDYTGFQISAVLPPGQNQLVIEALLPDRRWLQIFATDVHVAAPLLPLWLRQSDWMELMFFQMPASMKYAPRPIRLEQFPAAPVSPLRFSVVTPSFRQAVYLPETLASVTKQVGVKGQYVVQDGGSDDGSADIIRHHAASCAGATPASGLALTAWTSSPDNGQADAIARGFAQTSGTPDDVMAWINSDDFYVPGAFQFVADYFARHPEVDVLYGHRILVDENSQEIGRWFLPPHDPEVLRLNDFVPQETLFWRRRIWDRVGGIDPSFKFAMDWDLLLRFQAAGAKIVRVPYFLACFRIHPTQKTSAAMNKIGAAEITLLRERAQGRKFPAVELERHPRLLRYLRRSAWIEFLWRCGIRAR